LGIEALWALSTTSEDALVREKVCAVLGGKEGRRALAAIYPSQVKKEVERLRRSGEAQPIDFIAKNVLETWMKMKVAA
jgi:hypothetical protein